MTQDLDALPLPEPTWPCGFFGQLGNDAFTEDHIRAAHRKGYELAMRKAQEGREPVEYRRAVMGEGRVAIGCCINPDTGTPGIIYLDMGGAQRPIDADTSDLFEPGKQVDPSKILACVHFLTAEAVHQTIGVLHELLANDFGVTSTPPKSDEARDAERYRWLRSEHERHDPVCHLSWKLNLDRSSHEWVNTARLDAAIDDALAAQQKGGEA